MQLNTEASIDLGRQVHRAFGSWRKALDAARKDGDGVYRIPRASLNDVPAPRAD